MRRALIFLILIGVLSGLLLACRGELCRLYSLNLELVRLSILAVIALLLFGFVSSLHRHKP